MTVFKGYLRGALRQKVVICLYLAIFLGLGTLMTWSMDEGNQGEYEAETISMAVIDRDKSPLSKGLKAYLADTQEVKELEDNREVLKEELYYGNIQYVLVIPEGFGEALEASVSGKKEETGTEEETAEGTAEGTELGRLLEGTGRPGSTQSYYAAELTEGYLSGAEMYLKSGCSPEETARRMEVQAEKTGGSAVTLAEGTSSMSKVAGTFQYLPYVLTALSCYVIGFVMLDYQRQDIRRRLAVSATGFSRRLMEMLLAFAVIGAAFYAASFIMAGLMNPTGIFEEPNMQYYALNVLAMVTVGVGIAFLVVHIAGTANGVNGLANVIALGMSFLCGVFIPESMLSAPVRNIAKFLPVYWYEQNNAILGTHTRLTADLTEKLWSGFGIQFIFAAAVFILAMIIKKAKDR